MTNRHPHRTNLLHSNAPENHRRRGAPMADIGLRAEAR